VCVKNHISLPKRACRDGIIWQRGGDLFSIHTSIGVEDTSFQLNAGKTFVSAFHTIIILRIVTVKELLFLQQQKVPRAGRVIIG
jgi:hypothetical protein